MSGKNSSGSGSNLYYGTIAGALGAGPAHSLEWVILNNKVFNFSITKEEGQDFIEITFPDYGLARFYWGTETQNPDPDLNKYGDQPAYRGIVYFVLLDFCFGKNGETNAPNIEVGWRRHPNQEIVSAGVAKNDGAWSGNPMAITSELLTSWDWAGLPASKVNAKTFQDTGESLEVDFPSGADRSFSAMSPLWNEKTELKAALADIASVSGAWLRLGTDGRIEAGRWKRGGSIGEVTALTVNDLSAIPEVTAGESDDLPNSFLVEFNDASKHHKLNCTTPANTASVRSTGNVRRQTVKRPMLLSFDQANRHVADLLRENSVPKVSVSLIVRRSRAVNPDGSPIRPGDYFTFPIQVLPTDPADVRLFRCTRRSFEPVGEVKLSGELETNGAITSITPTPVVVETPKVTPPLYYRRVVALHPETTDDGQPVYVLAARPGDIVTGLKVHFDTALIGDFPVIVGQGSFALPFSLSEGISASAEAVTVSLLPKSGGINPRRDEHLIRNWSGGAIEAAADELLLIVVKKDGSGNVVWKDGDKEPFIEIMSVSGPASVVGTDTFSIPVLRGRMKTAACDFSSGTFPDAWATFEAWLVYRTWLVPIYHSSFEALMADRHYAYFRFSPSGGSGVYDPSAAQTERNRRAAASEDLGEFVNQTSSTSQPTDAYMLPPALLPPVNDGVLPLIQASGTRAFVFKRQNEKPDTPTTGTFENQVPEGWFDGDPGGDFPLWMTQRFYTYNGVGQDGTWSTPTMVSGDPTAPTNVVFMFSTVASPGTPSTYPQNWSPSSDVNTLWMASRTMTNGVWSAWTIAKIKGEAGSAGTPGAPGSSVSIQYSVDGSNWHDTYISGDVYMRQRIGSGAWGAAIKFVGAQGIPGVSGTYNYFLPSTSVPSSPAPKENDLWWQTDLKNFLKRYDSSGNWVNAGDSAFEIIGGVCYIKRAAIREVNAGSIVAGDMAAVNIAHTGRLYDPVYPTNKFFAMSPKTSITPSASWGANQAAWGFNHIGAPIIFDAQGHNAATNDRLRVMSDGSVRIMAFASIIDYAGAICLYVQRVDANNMDVGTPYALRAISSDDNGNARLSGYVTFSTIAGQVNLPTYAFKFYIAPCDGNGVLQVLGLTKRVELDIVAMNW